MKNEKWLLAIAYLLMVVGCSTPTPKDVVVQDTLPPIYPDYCDVTIPENIAPLNFLLRSHSSGGRRHHPPCPGP